MFQTKKLSVLLLLISVSLGVAIIFLALFIWSVRSGQYEDDYTPAVRMLFDEEDKDPKETTNQESNHANRKV